MDRSLSPLLLICLLLAALSAGGDERRPMRGRALDDVLDALKAEMGVQILYTERLVRPDMRVELEPTSNDPFTLLTQLLGPHGLKVEVALGDRYLVVRGAEPHVELVAGQVVSMVDGRPVAGALIISRDFDLELRTDLEGRFRKELHSAFFSLQDPMTWQLSAPGFKARQVRAPLGREQTMILALEPLSITGESVEVRASRPWVLGEDLSSLALERDDLLALPHLGNDALRSLSLLPGVNANESSAQLSVRGSRTDEVLIRLDGVEILEPYHLRDFNSFMSILSPQIIDEVELITGGFSAELGDRMGGVLELTTVRPRGRRLHAGLTPLDIEMGVGHQSASHGWLLTARGGSLEIPSRLAREQERPEFTDLYAKYERSVGERRSLSANVLWALDRLRFSELEPDKQQIFDTHYRNSYVWVADQLALDDRRFFTTRLSGTRIDRRRRGEEVVDGEGFSLRDDRSLTSIGLSHDWHWQPNSNRRLRWGFDVRNLDAGYNYFSMLEADDPLALIRPSRNAVGSRLDDRFRGQQYAAYITGLFSFGDRLKAELGLRLDRNTVLDDNHTEHPRLSLAYQLSPRARLQLAWGQYSQSQRLYELQVEDGLRTFAETEQSDQGSLGFETTFKGQKIGALRRPLTLRVEAYRRLVKNPRLRFENIFDPISLVSELEPDRIEIAPKRSLSEGIETFLGGAAGRSVNWFAGYTWARAQDRIHGVDVPRLTDQTHTLRADVSWHTPWNWDVHFAWRSQTGRPTTDLTAELRTQKGERLIVPELGPLNARRLPSYHRFDLRLSRHRKLSKGGDLEVYLQVHNALGRSNTRGYEFDFSVTGELVNVAREPLSWGGTIPSFGLRWRR